MTNFKSIEDRIDAGIEIRNHAEFEPEFFELFQNIESFWKQHPALGITERLVNAIEELVEVFDHFHFAEDAVHDSLPPLLFVFMRNRACSAKVAVESGLDRAGFRF